MASTDDLLSKIGISEGALDRVRLAQGVVGKSSYVAFAALIGLAVVAYSLKDPGYLLAIGLVIAATFLIFLFSVLWFAHKHPDTALLEGAELVRWRQIDMAAKGLPSPPQSYHEVVGGAH